MANFISDVTVNIGLEDVVNPVTFGGMLLYNISDNQLDYTECYGYEEAKNAIGANGADVVDEASISHMTSSNFSSNSYYSSSYSFTFQNTTSRTINGVYYTSRLYQLSSSHTIQVTPYTYSADVYLGVACVGASSDTSKTCTLTLANSSGDIVDSAIVYGATYDYITLTIPASDDGEVYTLYSTSSSGSTIHIYGLYQSTLSDAQIMMLEMAKIAFSQSNAPEKIMLLRCPFDSLTNYMDADWRYMMYIPSSEDISEYIDISDYIEASEYLKVVCLDLSTESGTGIPTYDDYAENIKSFNTKERTLAYVGIPVYDTGGNSISNSVCTALMAETGSKDVGSFTYKNQVLTSVYPDETCTKSQLTEYHSNYVNAFVTKAGYNVTSEGLLANGEYIDILDCKDWLITQIKYQLQQVLIISDKIPYTNTGITQLENCVVNVLKDAFNNGIIAEDDNGEASYTVNFPGRSETDASDRELRQYVLGEFSFELAGAIHTVTVNGTITI